MVLDMNERGFLGPIGDDLPSLIPIVTGLVIFFSIFVLTLNTYNEKNNYLEKQIDMTSVARDLKGDSLILNWEQFDKRCSAMKIKRYPYSFIIAFYGADVDLKDVIQEFKDSSLLTNEDVVNSGDQFSFLKQPTEDGSIKSFYCSYIKVGGKEFSSVKKQYSVRFYPIAVQQPILVATSSVTYQNLVVPAVMSMVVWE
jgi:hypothetical protein